MKKTTSILLMVILLAGCGSATPAPFVTTPLGKEFTLTPDQTATITATKLTIRLIGVGGDQRCPSEIECAISGPVSVSLSAQIGNQAPTNIDLQAFTGDDGRAPDMQFQGIQDRAIYEGYLIRIVGVLPYPAKSFNEIKASAYRVSVLVTKP
jgi:hypothetical protein